MKSGTIGKYNSVIRYKFDTSRCCLKNLVHLPQRLYTNRGVDGLTTDKGWGCMLRCGQMVLAEALVTLHLGRDWFWEPETKDPIYLKILRKFEDRRQAPFSIHQIAQMGASEGKEIGQWFGPNTVAQVLKYVSIIINTLFLIEMFFYFANLKYIFQKTGKV